MGLVVALVPEILAVIVALAVALVVTPTREVSAVAVGVAVVFVAADATIVTIGVEAIAALVEN